MYTGCQKCETNSVEASRSFAATGNIQKEIATYLGFGIELKKPFDPNFSDDAETGEMTQHEVRTYFPDAIMDSKKSISVVVSCD